MRLKRGVKLDGVKPPILWAIGVADLIWGDHGRNLVVTSLLDGKHKPGSKHYEGLAADLRTRDFSMQAAEDVAEDLRAEIDPWGFDVVLEDDHIHIEYDPKQGESWIKEVA